MPLFGRRKSETQASASSPPRVVVDAARRLIRGRFDAATNNDVSRRHWAMADSLSADAAASPGVRRMLRDRGRYETANNSYAKGIVLTLANDTVGSGPRLQLLTDNPDINDRVEEAFAQWCKAIDLPEKLRAMRMARAEAGEAFGVMAQNPRLNSRVKLDLRLFEADQVATPTITSLDPNAVDGVVFDAWGNPVEYHFLKRHPGDVARSGQFAFGHEYDTVPARNVIHYFRADRPGQSRGIPDITPALPLFALLRRYTLATIGAAETAANFAGILYTDAPAGGESEAVEPMDSIELEARALLTMPGGWRMEQMRAEQPTTTYNEFKREILNEIARCLNMPFNVAAGNSSGYNYASGRLDHQTYFKSLEVEQDFIERKVLDRLFAAFLDEAVLITGLLPLQVRSMIAAGELDHQWFWDGREHVDPAKEAMAQERRLNNNTTTLAAEYARKGLDWEHELRQRFKEKARDMDLRREFGLPESEPESASSMQAMVAEAVALALEEINTHE
ncbi:MAG: phage portal protein [Phycisphaerales bacterium]|nr:MAG: phage portal protein [Phycisphaerales bacterium]